MRIITQNTKLFYLYLIFFTFIIIVIFINSGSAQNKHPTDYFLFPFNPGTTNFLSGSMGELRTNHFHGGIDIKTAARVGLPILASADGYVSRINVSSYSYGNVLYITHPNGYVTVYAHLDKFNEAIGNYVKQQQYKLESFDVALILQPNELLVKKGQVIGLSGNSGSSGGPHLHYEIRDKQDKLFNPLLFGFSEIKDNIAPFFDKIALRTFDMKSRVNDDFGRFEYKALKKGNTFTILENITAYGTLGVEIKVGDKMNFTANQYGITCIELRLDNKEVFYHNVTSLPFEEHRYINAHIDYQTYIKQNRRFEKCYIADGNLMSTYKPGISGGKIRIADTLTHQIEIIVYDAYNNMAKLSFKVKGKKPDKAEFAVQPLKVSASLSTELFENTLKIKSKAIEGSVLQVFLKGITGKYFPDYYKNGQAIFLYDMRKGLPDSILVNDKIQKLDYLQAIYPKADITFTRDRFKLHFTPQSLFDTLYLQYANLRGGKGEEIYRVNDQSIPFFKPVECTIVPSIPVPGKSHTFIYNINKSPAFEGGTWNKNEITFNPKALGKFAYYSDTIKPVVKYVSRSLNSVRFIIFDSNSGIASIKASIDGKWVLMNHDHKRRLIWAELPDDTFKLQGKFVLEIADRCGNKNIYTNTFL